MLGYDLISVGNKQDAIYLLVDFRIRLHRILTRVWTLQYLGPMRLHFEQ